MLGFALGLEVLTEAIGLGAGHLEFRFQADYRVVSLLGKGLPGFALGLEFLTEAIGLGAGRPEVGIIPLERDSLVGDLFLEIAVFLLSGTEIERCGDEAVLETDVLIFGVSQAMLQPADGLSDDFDSKVCLLQSGALADHLPLGLQRAFGPIGLGSTGFLQFALHLHELLFQRLAHAQSLSE